MICHRLTTQGVSKEEQARELECKMNTVEIELDELRTVQKELGEVYENLTRLRQATMLITILSLRRNS
jgi:uncharacterized protein (DUF3084 family)